MSPCQEIGRCDINTTFNCNAKTSHGVQVASIAIIRGGSAMKFTANIQKKHLLFHIYKIISVSSIHLSPVISPQNFRHWPDQIIIKPSQIHLFVAAGGNLHWSSQRLHSGASPIRQYQLSSEPNSTGLTLSMITV